MPTPENKILDFDVHISLIPRTDIEAGLWKAELIYAGKSFSAYGFGAERALAFVMRETANELLARSPVER